MCSVCGCRVVTRDADNDLRCFICARLVQAAPRELECRRCRGYIPKRPRSDAPYCALKCQKYARSADCRRRKREVAAKVA